MAFNQNTDLILGEGLMIYVETGTGGSTTLKPIAYATTHTVAVNGETIDTSSKMSGNWQDSMVGQLNWQVTSDSLISRTTGHMSFNSLLEIMVQRKGVNIVIGSPTENDEDFALDDTKPTLEGQAIITSLDQTANRGEVCTSSITLQGKGELKSVSS